MGTKHANGAATGRPFGVFSIIPLLHYQTLQGSDIMSYLMYLRKSRTDMDAEARGEGETLARHRTFLTDFARRRGLFIGAVYIEIVSGETITSRPKMQQLLKEVEQGIWEGVIVMEPERLARSETIDQGIVAQAFKLSNTKIVTPERTYDPKSEADEEYFEFGINRRDDGKAMNARLQNGRLASVKEGKFVGSKPPYGYKKVRLPHGKGFTLEPIPEEAKVVELIYALYLNGENGERYGGSKICRKLNQLQVQPAKGDIWVNASVYDILKNPVYAGKIRWNWRPSIQGDSSKSRPRNNDDSCVLVDGLHKAIIEPSVFETVQERMQHQPVTRVRGDKSIQNPLSGLVVCQKCGRKLTRRPKGTRQAYDVLMCAVPECSNVSSKLETVESKLLEAIRSWVFEQNQEWENKCKTLLQLIHEKEETLEEINRELEETKKQLDNLHNLLERGVYNDATFRERSLVLNERLAAMKKTQTECKSSLNEYRSAQLLHNFTVPKMELLLNSYNELESPQEKNNRLKEVLEKVTYEKSQGGRWHNPEDFTLVVYPRVPESTK